MSKGAPKEENCKLYSGGEEGEGSSVRSLVIGVGSNAMPGALSSSSTCKRGGNAVPEMDCNRESGSGSGAGTEGELAGSRSACPLVPNGIRIA